MGSFLEVLYEPETPKTADLDVVFVHGMNPANVPNHAYRTWTHEDGTFWPRDLLPTAMPNARILLFGYNSNVAFGSTNATIFDHASSLLSLLSEKRQATKAESRLLLFVAHSLGGLVVKQALIIASLNSGDNHAVQESTIGIVFFATPHRGGNGVHLAEVVSNAVLRISGNVSAKNDILLTLKPLSRSAENLTQHFRPLLEKFVYISFFETRPKKVKKSLLSWVSLLVVERHSAVLGLASSRELQVSCDADHSEICKFEAKNFGVVSDTLAAFTAKARKEKEELVAKTKPKTAPATALPVQIPNFASYDDWLTQFNQPEPASASESSSGTTAEPRKTDVGLESIERDLDGEVNLPVFQDEVSTQLIISGLKRDGSSRKYCVKASVGGCTRIDELILSLKEKGFAPLYGFHNTRDNIGLSPSLHVDTPFPVTVTSFPSRYAWSTGPLLINEDETFDYFGEQVALHRPMYITMPPSGDSPAPSLAGTKIQVRCGSVRLAISFMRTLRIPDTDELQMTPSAMGRFPLFNAAQFASTLPPSMVQKGGLFLPMYQREAMFMLFECESDHGTKNDPHFVKTHHWDCRESENPEALAMRVYIGGVNVLTGKPAPSPERLGKAQEAEPPQQDYLVVPGQKTLYGVSSGDGSTVRQFVAMRPGFGYTVEEQLADTRGSVGGIQLEFWQEKQTEPPQIRPMYPPMRWKLRGTKENVSPTRSEYGDLRRAGANTPRKLGLKVEDEFNLQECPLEAIQKNFTPYATRLNIDDDCHYPDPSKQRAALIHDLFPGKIIRPGAVLEVNAVTDPLIASVGYAPERLCDVSFARRNWREGPPVEKNTLAFRARRWRPISPEECRSYKCSPFLMGWELHNMVRSDAFFKLAKHQPHHVYLGFNDKRVWNERIWSERHKTLFGYGIRGAQPVELYCFYDPPTGPEAILDRDRTKKSPTWQLGISGGGLLRQDIYPDPIQPPFSRWDVTGARFINIQILDSVAFNMVTGMPAPQTPVTVQVYAACGLQYSKDYDEPEPQANPGSAVSTTAQNGTQAHESVLAPVKSTSQTNILFQAAKRIVSRGHVEPGAPATACQACEVRDRKESRGQGLCDQILRPCHHAVCADCRDELVVELMSLGLQADVLGAAIFLCPLCGEPVSETLPLAAPMKVPEGERLIGFILQGIQSFRR